MKKQDFLKTVKVKTVESDHQDYVFNKIYNGKKYVIEFNSKYVTDQWNKVEFITNDLFNAVDFDVYLDMLKEEFLEKSIQHNKLKIKID